MSYRFLNPAPVFFDLLGLNPIPGGSLRFYDRGTTDDKDTWSNEGLTVLNENPVPLDAGGRSETSIFLDGEYTVVCKNAAGETIWTRDVYPGGDAALTIPSPTAGYFLTSPDGVNLAWSEIFQMPDPTGSTNQYPVTDGSGYVLTNLPEPPDTNEVTTNSCRIYGDSDDTYDWLIQKGTDSANASNLPTTSKAVEFPTAFSAAPDVKLCPTSNSQPGGPIVAYTTTVSATGFTAVFDVAEGDPTDQDIINPVPFSWIAQGVIAKE